MSSPRILCLGIGNMGAALAQTLLRSSSPTTNLTIWNRTPSRPLVQSLVDAGAKFEPNLVTAIAHADIILICLLDYPAIYTALHPVPSLASKTIINLTNGTPRQATDAQTWMTARGAELYLDGAVMVTPQLVGTPHAFLLFSGATEARFQAAMASVVAPLGTALYTGEDVTSAAASDLAALAAMYGMFAGAFVGMGLLQKQLARSGSKGDAKIAPAVEKVVVPLLAALVPYVGQIATAVDEEAWEDNMGNPLGMQLAGVRNILQACKEEGVDGGGLDALASLMQRVMVERGGDGGVAEVVRLVVE
ncbi:hypothetical protein P152DRAFT_247054 [Eremomyces bilateralis CBS 781.70]|uniref:6-phosphogluconate dehydrogenase NADP-binding domain-containing protein n=1 Tax=Eremomyces bilateralis CBS 781.70 TaxID=1392243 RepID=A0A6G1GAM4_9PEZI|nr:uncharacterized protein P152DRAFT_247054 [Eremomyces bilateralis CBS 781.70]KAF1815138.1 hypothetical protein P152DRAFT_247054 [Eremomyces bilateralis CBS 781.70]